MLLSYYHMFLLEYSDKSPPPPPLSDNAKGFLATLEHSSEEELTLHLQDRMQFSKEAIARLVCVFDRLHSRIDNMCKQVQAAGNWRNVTEYIIIISSNWLPYIIIIVLVYKPKQSFCEFGSLFLIWKDYWPFFQAYDDDSQSEVISVNCSLLEDNVRLRDLATLLQGRHHKMSMEVWRSWHSFWMLVCIGKCCACVWVWKYKACKMCLLSTFSWILVIMLFHYSTMS